ncbi:NAD(P)H dehydrogenase (quinone) [Paraliobacillus quinghaiensis]|uniref:NAD(P)H dehydrogenase (Quinone) n=1 Tax=Paraliobacillus quinghaiensis TaxID=470815 RepID=A0A917TNS2_9BACI|nr:NAD(P)H-dependent oxidoreductase [Paraliobacillus quinghaiensis]GGM27731.1 NAD(P)H dehydrogenase (quinone) [Paraliobacillus quinghaiensis]
MKNIFIINGHESYPKNDGRLNQTIFEAMINKLQPNYNIRTTTVDKGYLVEEEHDKFAWADIVIYQTPIYWFNVPGKLKTYFDEVYTRDVLFKKVEQYGTGGLLTEKKYMLSTTWGAPLNEFATEEGFFQGRDVDETLFHLHRTQAFLGMKPLKSFSIHSVMKHPNIPLFLEQLDAHLEEVFDC